MMNDEKKCPITKMTCYGEECAMWYDKDRRCSVPAICSVLIGVDNDIYELRRSVIHLMEKVIR